MRPSTAWYWHMGESTARLRSARPRSRRGEKRRGWLTGDSICCACLLRRDPKAAAGAFRAVDAVHEIVELLHHELQLLEAGLALPAQLLEGGEGCPHIADGIARSGGQRLGIALMTIGGMALGDDRLHLPDQPLD